MFVTAIRQQQRDVTRYSVYIDSKYCFSLGQDALLDSGLVSGQELGKEQLDAYKRLSQDDRLYASALRYAVLRPRSEWEMLMYLQKKHSPTPIIEQITNKLRSLDLLNDSKLAQMLVNDRQLLRPTSRRGLVQLLAKKRIPNDVIEQALAVDIDESGALQAVLQKKLRIPRYRSDPKKLLAYLARQGFKYDDIKKAFEEVDFDSQTA